MSSASKIAFNSFSIPGRGVLIVFCGDGVEFGSATRKALGKAADLVRRAAKAERFSGKSGSSLELLMPEGLKADRLVVVSTGKAGEFKPNDALKLGGVAMGKVPKSTEDVTVFAELPAGALDADQAADLAQGIALRAYAFDRYKTKRKDDEKTPDKRSVTVAVQDPGAVRKAYARREAITGGVLMARDL